MSQILVNHYLNDLDRYKKISGSLTEGIISEAFKDLLKAWSRQANLHFINQYEFVSTQKTRIMICACLLAIGRQKTPMMILMRKLPRS
jgi:hypothetical protein